MESRTLNVVLLSVIVIYVLHKVIKRGLRKRVLFAIVFFAIISYFSLRSFFAAFSGMTRSPRGLNETREAESSMRFTIKENRTAIPAPYSYLEAAAEMEPAAAQVSAVVQAGEPHHQKDVSLHSNTPKAEEPGKTPLAQSVVSIAMANISSLLTGCKVEHAMLYGSLLGLIRDGKPIDGDNDLDLLLPSEARKALLVCPAFGRPCTRKVKHNCIKQHAPWLWQSNVLVEATPVLIDFYIGLTVGNAMCMCHDKCAFPLRAVYPFRILEASNGSDCIGCSSFFGPNAPVEITALSYGPDWRIPVRKKSSTRFKNYFYAIMPSSVKELYAKNCSLECFPGDA